MVDQQQQQVKRRRVTRACDECRKKKVKCDGQQPCIHCTVYSYECTYNQPTKRNTSFLSSSQQQQQPHQHQTQQPHQQLQRQMSSNANVSTLSTSSSSVAKKSPQKEGKLHSQLNKYKKLFHDILPNLPDIETLDVQTFSQIFHNFHSADTSSSILGDTVKEYLLIANETTPHSSKTTTPDGSSSGSVNNSNSLLNADAIESIDGSIQSHMGREIKIILPPKPIALQFLKNAWEHCCVLLRFYHRPSFIKQFDELYETDPQNYTHDQMQFLPLCYSTMAVGALFSKSIIPDDEADETAENIDNNTTRNNENDNDNDNDVQGESNDKGHAATNPSSSSSSKSNTNANTSANFDDNFNNTTTTNNNNNNNNTNNTNTNNTFGNNTSKRDKFLEDEGYKYFIAARKLIDITNARDINSIQTILMLFIFLQCSARLSTCYAYIGVAMRSALREGLHRCLTADSGFNPIEIEMRKRLFYTIHKLDIYVNAMLGLPRSISPCDFDQTLPIELSDENISEQGYFPENQNGVLSSAGIANQHTKLIMILDTIVRELYPIKKTNNLISHEIVTELELKLRNWLDGLPQELIPGLNDVPKKYETANRLLHLSFLHVQLILYRPFIHYLSRNVVAKNPDSLSIQRARNSISVARTAINLAKGMLKKNLLIGSYWYGSYTIFYSVAGLLFYIHEAQPTDKESAREYNEILKDAEMGRNVLLQLKDSSMAANRTYNLLNKLFERLNSKTIRLSAIHGGTSDNVSRQQQQQSQQFQHPQQVQKQATTVAPQSTQQNSQISDAYNIANYMGPEFGAALPMQNSPSSAESMKKSPSKSMSRSMKTISGVNTINTAATSNITTNENDIFLKSDTTPLDGLFMFDGNASDIFGGSNITDNSFKGLDPMSLSGDATSVQPTMSPKAKNEAIDSESYIPGVFDQLDVQLFGRYLPPYMSQQTNTEQQTTPQSDFKQ